METVRVTVPTASGKQRRRTRGNRFISFRTYSRGDEQYLSNNGFVIWSKWRPRELRQVTYYCGKLLRAGNRFFSPLSAARTMEAAVGNHTDTTANRWVNSFLSYSSKIFIEVHHRSQCLLVFFLNQTVKFFFNLYKSCNIKCVSVWNYWA